MNNDHLSPEPLSTYEEGNEVSQEPSNMARNRQNYLNTAEPFTKVELDKQKREREVPEQEYHLTPNGAEYSGVKRYHSESNEMQIKHREKVLESLQNRARDDFNISHDNQGRGLEL